MNTESKKINEQIQFGLDTIDSELTVEIKLKDFMLIYKTFEELNRFFHQPLHYPTIDVLQTFLGNKEIGAYSIISNIYYKVLPQYLPSEIEAQFGESNDPFENPEYPFYYNLKSDEDLE